MTNVEYHRQWRLKHASSVKATQIRYQEKHASEILERNRIRSEDRKLKWANRARSPYCEVCGTFCRTVLDHDHKTGKFRGWLCSPCNSALGHAHDNPAVLEALMRYVMRHFVRESMINPVIHEDLIKQT